MEAPAASRIGGLSRLAPTVNPTTTTALMATAVIAASPAVRKTVTSRPVVLTTDVPLLGKTGVVTAPDAGIASVQDTTHFEGRTVFTCEPADGSRYWIARPDPLMLVLAGKLFIPRMMCWPGRMMTCCRL